MKLLGIKQIIKGILTFLPGWQRIARKEGGGANSARYCYSVWLRHRILAERFGFTTSPNIVAELGPGDSIGSGLAAILSGCRSYLAFDIVPFTALKRNLIVLEELVDLFKQKAPIPDDTEFPNLQPRLDNYDFPDHLLTASILRETLSKERIEIIRNALLSGNLTTNGRIEIRYVAPWNSVCQVKTNSVDLIFSQAVMEHVDDLQNAYQTMHCWLRSGGMISHEIDFKCHSTAKVWNGHWAYPDPLWKIIKGRRPYFLNRKTCEHHIDLIQTAGFNIKQVTRHKITSSIRRTELCNSLKNITDEDLNTSSAHIIAIKGEI